MKKLAVMAATIAYGFTTSADDVQAKKDPLWPAEIVTISLDAKQSYVDRNGVEWYDRSVANMNLLINLPKGFRLEMWGSWGPEGDHGGTATDLGDEIDYALAWSGEAGPVTLDFGLSYYDLVGIGKGTAGDVFTPFIGVSREFEIGESHTLEPYAKANWYVPGKNSGFEGGIWTTVGLRHGVSFTKFLSLSHELRTTHDDGAYGLQAGFVGQYEASLCWKVSGNVSLRVPTVLVSKPLNGFSDRSAKTILGFGLDVSF